MKNEGSFFLVYPDNFKITSSSELQFCNFFINSLVFSKNNILRFSVYKNSKLIECNDPELKGTLLILLGAKKLEIVKKGITELLHRNALGQEALGLLKVVYAGKSLVFAVNEIKSNADLAWEITRIEA